MMDFLKRWWKRFRRRSTVGRVVIIDSMTSVPAKLGSDVYFVRQGNFDKRVVFICPCGCGRRIDLNLVRTQHPSWSAHLRNGQISISPSVWLTADPCQSHFFIKNNKVEWAE